MTLITKPAPVGTPATTTREADAQKPGPLQKVESEVKGWVTKAKTAVKRELGEGISATPTLKVPLMDISAYLHADAQFAFPGTQGFKDLVAGDSIREKYAKDTGKTYVRADGGLGATVDLPLGGVHLGMTREVDASFVNAYTFDSLKHTAKSGVQMLKDAGATFILPKDAKHLKAHNWAPGAEMVIRSHSADHKGVDVGIGAAVVGPLVVSPFVGTSKATDVRHTRTIKHLGDDKYYTQIGQLKTTTRDYKAGVKVGVAVPVRTSPITAPITEETVTGGATPVIQSVVAVPTGTKASVGRATETTHEVLAAGIFDLKKHSDTKRFDAIHTMPAANAALALKMDEASVDPMAVATIEGKRTIVHGEVSVLGVGLLDAQNSTGMKNATVFVRDQGTTTLKEATGGATREGVIYRLVNEGMMPKAVFDGIERKAEVALGTVQRPGQTTSSRAMQLELDVTDHKLLREEAQEWGRFATAMGGRLAVPDKKSFGKANLKVSAAYDDAQVAKIIEAGRKDPQAVMLAIAGAQASIDGKGLPPWVGDPQGFEYRISQYERTQEDEVNPRDQGRKDYRFDHPGRDLDADISSYRTAKLVSKALASMQGGAAAEDFKELLQVVGQQYSRDVRNVTLAFKTLGGGALTRLDVKAKGFDSSLEAAPVPVQGRLREEVGKLLQPESIAPALSAPEVE